MRHGAPQPFSLLLLGTLLLSGAGCSTAPAVRVGSMTVSFDEVVAQADRREETLRSLRGEGNIQIESPSFSQSAAFTVTLLRPDSLELEIKGPFGITVAQALVTREEFQLYNILQNRLYTGRTSPENLEKALRVPLTFDDILSLFTGGTVLRADRQAVYTTSADGPDAVFLFPDGGQRRRYVVDPATKDIRKVQLLSDAGAPIGEQSFSSFETDGNVTYPRRISLTQHKDRRRVTLFYESVNWNVVSPSSFTFSVPRNAERVELE